MRASSSSRFLLLDPLGATPDNSLFASLLVKLMNIGAALPDPRLALPLAVYLLGDGVGLKEGLFAVGGAEAGGTARDRS